MIIVFTTGMSANEAGQDLTKQFEDWKNSLNHECIEIINLHTTSNNFGWMLTVHYKVLRY